MRRTPLHEAVSMSRVAVAHYFIYKGCNVKSLNSAMETPQDLAVKCRLSSDTIAAIFSKSFSM